MAMYKYANYLKPSQHEAFDQIIILAFSRLIPASIAVSAVAAKSSEKKSGFYRRKIITSTQQVKVRSDDS